MASGSSYHYMPHVEPGPRTGDILVLQSQHRSDKVWEDPDVQPLKIHRSDAEFWKACPLDVRVQAILVRVGFYGVYIAGGMQLDHSLITALVERWRQETHTFHLPLGEATVTLQDVAVLWGLPVDGNPVSGQDLGHSIVEWQIICHELLGYVPSPDDFDGDRLKLKSISRHLRLDILTDESTEIEILQQARCRILQIIGSIMGDKSGTKIKLMYLLLLSDIDEASSYSWGSATLASLYRALCRASDRDAHGICGPLHLLQLWTWERLPTIRPHRHIRTEPLLIFPNMPTGPRSCMWNTSLSFSDVGSHVLRVYRDRFDYMLDGDFIWQPYSEDDLQQLPYYCSQGREIWGARVPLINFDVVELHLPERVMRQFGYQQHVPAATDTGFKLHKTDRRGKKGINWLVHHACHIEHWANRRENIVEGVPTSTPVEFFSEYIGWYRQITRLLIGNPEHRPANAARPMASVMEFWSGCWSQVYNVSKHAITDREVDPRLVLENVCDMCERALTIAGESRRIEAPRENFEGQSGFEHGHDGHDRPSTSRGFRTEDSAEDEENDQSFSHHSRGPHDETPHHDSPPRMESSMSSQFPTFDLFYQRRRRRREGTHADRAIPFQLGSSESEAPQRQTRINPQALPLRRQPRRNAGQPPCGT